MRGEVESLGRCVEVAQLEYSVYFSWYTWANYSTYGSENMQLTFYTVLLAFLVLAVGITTASPIPSSCFDHRRRGATSPRIFCTTWNGKKVCEKFEVPVVRRSSTPPSQNRFSATIISSGQLVSKEVRQIQRIMNVKGEVKSVKSDEPWLLPDVQVVLWFVLLCCLTEGMVSGFRW